MASEVIKLNIIPTGEMPVFHCSQFDNDRLINIELYRGEDAYTIPEGCTAELHCRKVDGNIVTIGSPVVDENTIKFTSTTQLTACNGKNLCEVAILGADDYLIGSLNFWLEVELDPLKGGINSTSEIHDLYDQIEDITEEVIGDNYYDKTETDALLDDKADVSSVYTKTETDAKLALKANASSVYTKSETDTLLLTKADASDVYTKAQVETKLAAKADSADVYTKDETDTLLDAKANANGVYSKVEVDAMVDDIEDAIDLKADQSTTYTKTEVDTALALKANAADVYTKAQVDSALALKANAADVYTKTQVDEKFLDIMPVDTATGAVANFTTALAVELVDCTSAIVATGGNGTPDNPVPIVGYTEANITANGNTYTISFGQTVYGGVLDVTRGKLTVTHGKYVLDNTATAGQFDINTYTDRNRISYVPYQSDGKLDGTFKADKLETAPNAPGGIGTGDYQIFGSTTAPRMWITVPTTIATLADFLTYISSNPIEVVYELTTPFDIDLTPVQIRAIVGVNNVFADTGNIEVKFKDTIQNYIDKKVGT